MKDNKKLPEKIIFHIDVNSAFLSWEAVYRLHELHETLDLRSIPSAVGGDQAKRRGVILAKSPLARRYGVKTGEPIVDALRKCPDLKLVRPNHDLYQRCSHAFMEILREYTPDVEPYSIDEAFMDMTGTRRLWGEPESAANCIRERIYNELGFTVNIGVSTNRLLAKMASDFEKPNKVHTLFPWELEQKMWPLPVSELFFVGKATAQKLRTMGIRTIGDLAKTDRSLIQGHLKKHGEIIWEFANGMDVSIVDNTPEPNKGYGNSTTIAFDVTDADTAKMVLLSLSETVAARLREHQVKAEVISVSIKNSELHQVSHQTVLSFATDITAEIHRVVCQLFDELWNGDPIRLLGVYASKVRDHDFTRQMDLFDHTDYDKLEKLDAAVDAIRHKFGIDAVKRASFLENNMDHMPGKRHIRKRDVSD